MINVALFIFKKTSAMVDNKIKGIL